MREGRTDDAEVLRQAREQSASKVTTTDADAADEPGKAAEPGNDAPLTGEAGSAPVGSTTPGPLPAASVVPGGFRRGGPAAARRRRRVGRS